MYTPPYVGLYTPLCMYVQSPELIQKESRILNHRSVTKQLTLCVGGVSRFTLPGGSYFGGTYEPLSQTGNCQAFLTV